MPPRKTTRADETVTVRMPAGTANKLRAATGQPFSTLVRFIMLAVLDKYAQEGKGNVKAEVQQDIANVVQQELG